MQQSNVASAHADHEKQRMQTRPSSSAAALAKALSDGRATKPLARTILCNVIGVKGMGAGFIPTKAEGITDHGILVERIQNAYNQDRSSSIQQELSELMSLHFS